MAGPDPLVCEVAARLAISLGERAVVCLRCPVVLHGIHAPPLVVTAPPLAELPLPAGRLLLVGYLSGEVRDDELLACARAGVTEVWLIDDEGNGLDVLQLPSGGVYRRRLPVLPGEEILVPALAAGLTPLPGRAG